MSDSRIHHRRFFVPVEFIRGEWVEFAPAQAHQMAHVLRLRQGDHVSVFDGTGRELIVSLSTPTSRRVTARILSEAPRLPSPRLRVSLAQVVPRGAAMDLIVAKATELGVVRIVPLEGERSVRRASPKGSATHGNAMGTRRTGRSARWARIVQEAAEQCGRQDLPAIAPTSTLEAFLVGHQGNTPLLACHAGTGARPLTSVCQELGHVSALTFLVGGEGGLSPDEVEGLRSHGAHLASLGPRLLRADTAALAALAVLQACLGDWMEIANEKRTTDN